MLYCCNRSKIRVLLDVVETNSHHSAPETRHPRGIAKWEMKRAAPIPMVAIDLLVGWRWSRNAGEVLVGWEKIVFTDCTTVTWIGTSTLQKKKGNEKQFGNEQSFVGRPYGIRRSQWCLTHQARFRTLGRALGPLLVLSLLRPYTTLGKSSPACPLIGQYTWSIKNPPQRRELLACEGSCSLHK